MDLKETKITQRFYRDDIMRVGEKVLFQEKCQYLYITKVKKPNEKKAKSEHNFIDGLLIITNCAIRFKESQDIKKEDENMDGDIMDDEYSIVYNRLKLNSDEIKIALYPKTENHWALRVSTNDAKPKNLTFVFIAGKSDYNEQICNKVK